MFPKFPLRGWLGISYYCRVLLFIWKSDDQTKTGRVRELNWTNWAEALGLRPQNWTERTGSQPDQAGKMNWTTLFKQFWTEFASLRHHTTPRKSKQSQPVKRTIHPGDKHGRKMTSVVDAPLNPNKQTNKQTDRRQTPGRRAGISAGGDLELLLCSSQPHGDSMD